MRDALRAYGSH
uniref:Uncharacterized protein n=1 Tax=Anguilla anguilla TaxID=7936 RepID=A0A0E9T2B9_ANGAN